MAPRIPIEELPKLTLNQIIARDPDATAVLSHHGFDTCCGGEKTLDEVCRRHQVDLAQVVADLTSRKPNGPARPEARLRERGEEARR